MRVELKERTKVFALRVLKLVDALPNSRAGRIVAAQPGCAGTGVGANYRAACRARSRAEFIAKVGMVEAEADETAFWRGLTAEGAVLPPSKATAVHSAGVELTAIMAGSRITASRNKR
jgi:four helix bundle protein